MMARNNLQRELSLDGLPVPDSAVSSVQGEEFLFHSILANLIKNAVEASPAGGKISVALISQPEFAVSIHNIGAIPAHIRSRFFDRYVTSGKEDGTGLGVFSAHLMARTMGGDLSFATDDTDGTTLTLAIPANPVPKNIVEDDAAGA
jgi:signal transduction histidine kinase